MKIRKMNVDEFCEIVEVRNLKEIKVFGAELGEGYDQVIYHYYDAEQNLVAIYHDVGAFGLGDYYYLS